MTINERGDTIIEVILASSILALVTVSSFAIMERASASAYDALERSEVRLSINGQVELLNYFRENYIKSKASGISISASGTKPADMWLKVSEDTTNSTPPTLDTCSAPSDSFYLDRNGTTNYQMVASPSVASTGLPVPGKGLWIKKITPSGQSPKRYYHEFYVIACWPTTAGGEQRMSSIVRLHDPAL